MSEMTVLAGKTLPALILEPKDAWKAVPLEVLQTTQGGQIAFIIPWDLCEDSLHLQFVEVFHGYSGLRVVLQYGIPALNRQIFMARLLRCLLLGTSWHPELVTGRTGTIA